MRWFFFVFFLGCAEPEPDPDPCDWSWIEEEACLADYCPEVLEDVSPEEYWSECRGGECWCCWNSDNGPECRS